MRFCSTTNSFQSFLYDFIHFPCVLITSHPLKTFRIMENITSSFCLQWNRKFGRAPSLMVQYFLRKDRMRRLSFLRSTAFRGHSWKTWHHSSRCSPAPLAVLSRLRDYNFGGVAVIRKRNELEAFEIPPHRKPSILNRKWIDRGPHICQSWKMIFRIFPREPRWPTVGENNGGLGWIN